MIHRENERSEHQKIRGAAYTLTDPSSAACPTKGGRFAAPKLPPKPLVAASRINCLSRECRRTGLSPCDREIPQAFKRGLIEPLVG